jgi:hypothetical protein
MNYVALRPQPNWKLAAWNRFRFEQLACLTFQEFESVRERQDVAADGFFRRFVNIRCQGFADRVAFLHQQLPQGSDRAQSVSD